MLDNGFAAVDGPEGLRQICDGLGPDQIDALLRKWLARLPHPFGPADRAAGYRYDISILQAEFSLTQMLDKPVSGRIFFDQMIRDNLDIGRPDQIGLVFDRRILSRGPRPTPGRFRTRVITDGVTPSLHVDYKNAKIRQYHKLGRALRTETTINDTWDFEDRETADQPARPAQDRLHRQPTAARRPTTQPPPRRRSHRLGPGHRSGHHRHRRTVAGLRPTDPRAQALLAILCVFRLPPNGFTNADLRHHLAPMLGRLPGQITSGQITYDLRRLRHHGLIERIPHTFRYRLTGTGMRSALFLTRVHQRLWRTGPAELTDPNPPLPSRLRTADRNYQAAIDDLTRQAGLAA